MIGARHHIITRWYFQFMVGDRSRRFEWVEETLRWWLYWRSHRRNQPTLKNSRSTSELNLKQTIRLKKLYLKLAVVPYIPFCMWHSPCALPRWFDSSRDTRGFPPLNVEVIRTSNGHRPAEVGLNQVHISSNLDERYLKTLVDIHPVNSVNSTVLR